MFQLTVESVDLEPDCKINFLRIYNGRSTEDPLQKEYCGPITNEVLIIHPSTFIEFHSSSNKNSRKGFRLRASPTNTGKSFKLKSSSIFLHSVLGDDFLRRLFGVIFFLSFQEFSPKICAHILNNNFLM